MNKIFNTISSTSTLGLFFVALGLSILLTGSFFGIILYYPELFLKDVNNSSLTYNLTIFGKFYMISGILPNFLLIVVIFRIIKSLIIISLKILAKILSLIFTEKNINYFDNLINKLEKTIVSQTPKIKVAVNKIKSKKDIKSEYLTPLALIISSIIIATAILLQ